MLVNALTPTITNLYPSAVLVGSAALTVTITGTGFYKGTTAIAAASPTPLKTTFVNSTTLVAVLPAGDLASAGPINVQAVNPAPGGNSTSVAFTVSATPVVQAILSSASYAAGGVSPGEFVVLFGTNIGPVVPAGMSVVAGYAATSVLQRRFGDHRRPECGDDLCQREPDHRAGALYGNARVGESGGGE